MNWRLIEMYVLLILQAVFLLFGYLQIENHDYVKAAILLVCAIVTGVINASIIIKELRNKDDDS